MERELREVGPSAAERLQAARLDFNTQVRRFEQAQADLQEIVDEIRKGRSRREILHRSAFARLQAKLDSMPVIEQAKGILMAEQRCGPDEAFDLLRRASQRANIKVSVLAAQIVGQIASSSNGPSAVPAKPVVIAGPDRERPSHALLGTHQANGQSSALGR